MRVLWFSITPANYSKGGNTVGTWIESLERIVTNRSDVELGICFISKQQDTIHVQGKVKYYPVYSKRNFLQVQYDKYSNRIEDKLLIKKFIDVINDFKPEIIHVFGSEWCFGHLVDNTSVPIIIHIQGCWPVYLSVKNSIFVTDWDIVSTNWYNPKHIISYFLGRHKTQERAEREISIIRKNKFFFVRTRWDKAIVGLINPSARFFYCSEALRNSFVSSKKKWEPHQRSKIILVTVSSSTFIKGYDLILKTASILKTFSSIDFEWNLVGCTKKTLKIVSKKVGVSYESVGVVPKGVLGAEEIVSNLLNSDIYIHSAYIDNSPNSLCEAQYLGMPIISTYVGGIPSLFSHNYDYSMLVGVNDEFYLASKILELANNKPLQRRLSESNIEISHIRHKDDQIYHDLLSAYNAILFK